jgi:hypothetical protein
MLSISSILFISVFSLSGCTSNQAANKNTSGVVNSLVGTWVGTAEISMFGGGNTTSISQISFTTTTAKLTVDGKQGPSLVNCTYTVNGNTIVLQPTFNNRGGFPGGQPFNGTFPVNGTRPPGNGTWPPEGSFPDNGSLPPNGTRPPGNGSFPGNGTQPPENQRLSASISLTYRFTDDETILFLNESEFTRIV